MSSKKETTSKKPHKVTSRKASATTPRKAQRKTASNRKKVVKKWEIPVWLYYILMGLITVAFAVIFYYFFIS